MNMTQLLQAGAMVVLLSGWGILSGVQAAEVPATFNETIGGPLGSTDKYGLLCAPGNTGGSARVNDPVNDTVHLNVCITNTDGIPGQCQKSPVFGSSPLASATGGPGFYIVDVFKSSTGNPPQPYTVTIDCLGEAPGTVFLLQDQ
jgi:hypothetical protein